MAMAWFDIRGNSVTTVYNIHGNAIHMESIPVDPVEPIAGYGTTLDEAISEWEQDYRESRLIVPCALTTDQHGSVLRRKPLFDYLRKRIRWDEISAFLNLGDTMSGSWSIFEANDFLKGYKSIPVEKRLSVMGNHDAWTPDNGSTRMCTRAEVRERLAGWFDNSNFWSGYQITGNAVETVVDPVHRVRYILINPWDDGYGDYGKYKYSTDTISGLIEYLSIADGNDVVFVSHVNPLSGVVGTVVTPPTDGRAESSTRKGIGSYGLSISLDQILTARKQRTRGSFTDEDGVVHTYDFTGCTSDVLCSVNGHEHLDYITWFCGFPNIGFDALNYDAHPVFLFNVHKDCVKIWKCDDGGNAYRYSVPIDEDVRA